MAKKTNVYIEIFKNHWAEYKVCKPQYETEYYNSVVEKMINCGDPAVGFIEYQCMYCGEDNLVIGSSCKKSLCLRCGAIRAYSFVEEVMAKLHPGIVYRHLTLTIPIELRTLFYKNSHSKELYNKFFKVGWDCICDLLSKLTKIPVNKLKGGCIVVLHIPGRNSTYNPHLHFIFINGSLDIDKNKWISLSYFPYEILRKKWQYFLSKMIVEFDPTAATKKIIDDLWKKHGEKGFVFNFDKANVPRSSEAIARYLSKYLFRPAISVKRILKYDKDKKTVEYEYACHETGRIEKAKVSVIDFIGKMIQQVLPKGYQRVRYYGLQATSSFAKSKEQIHTALGKDVELIKDKNGEIIVKRAQRLGFREKILKWHRKDPLKCKKCGNTMEVVKIWVKGIGTIFDLFEKMKVGPPKIDFIRKKEDDLLVVNKKLEVQLDFFSFRETELV